MDDMEEVPIKKKNNFLRLYGVFTRNSMYCYDFYEASGDWIRNGE